MRGWLKFLGNRLDSKRAVLSGIGRRISSSNLRSHTLAGPVRPEQRTLASAASYRRCRFRRHKPLCCAAATPVQVLQTVRLARGRRLFDGTNFVASTQRRAHT
jgi:hypothetical protein